MPQRMGLDLGLDTCPGKRRKFRWMLNIPDVVGGSKQGSQVKTLPPLRSARPSLSFREMEARHLIENIYYPSKVEWKPIQLTVYDVSGDDHPILKWLKEIYDPEKGTWKPCATDKFIKEANLKMLDSCGETIETWVYEDVWPQVTDFGELDMGVSDVVTCDLTLRYARAYIRKS